MCRLLLKKENRVKYYNMKSKLSDDEKNEIINDLNIKIGSDINNLLGAYDTEVHLVQKRKHLQSCVCTLSLECIVII